MKKIIIAVFSACLLISYSKAFQDRPALTKAEDAVFFAVRVAGAGGLGLLGAKVGGKAGAWAGRNIDFMRRVAPGDRKLMRRYYKWRKTQDWSSPVDDQRRADFYTHFRQEARGIIEPYLLAQQPTRSLAPEIYVGAYTAGAAGSLLGYKVAKKIAIFALAKKHGVSIPVEQISIEYDVNIEQYRLLLEAAEQKNTEQLRAAIEEIFPLRFKRNWREYFGMLAKIPLSVRSALAISPLRIAESDFKYSSLGPQTRAWFVNAIRMLQLGAAMAHLYAGTQPALIDRTWIPKALSLYQMLGFIPKDVTPLSLEAWKEALSKELK